MLKPYVFHYFMTRLGNCQAPEKELFSLTKDFTGSEHPKSRWERHRTASGQVLGGDMAKRCLNRLRGTKEEPRGATNSLQQSDTESELPYGIWAPGANFSTAQRSDKIGPSTTPHSGRTAELLERRAHNPKVPGSTPSADLLASNLGSIVAH